jgi:hypothetical protein
VGRGLPNFCGFDTASYGIKVHPGLRLIPD